MQPKNIARYTDKMNLVADELVDNIKHLAKQNKDGEMPDDFRNELYKWSLESVGVVTLDTHLGILLLLFFNFTHTFCRLFKTRFKSRLRAAKTYKQCNPILRFDVQT